MLADFTITIHNLPSGKARGTRVKVHDNVKSLRAACSQYENRYESPKKRKYGKFHDTLGICHRFHMMNNPVCNLVRLAPPNLGTGVLSHEMAHAAVHIWEIEHQFETPPITCSNDELFCWILGELVWRAVDKMYDLDVYE